MTETTHSQPSLSTLYESDFYAWTQEQVKLLNEGKWTEVDLANIVEEIDSLGKQQRQELENRLTILLGHLLKWQFQPSMRSKSWRLTIREQRRQIQRHLKQNPSLKPYIPEAMQESYEGGVILAAKETSLETENFPEACPYRFEEAIDDPFFPDLNESNPGAFP
jgi:Domain of unknown function DUF29